MVLPEIDGYDRLVPIGEGGFATVFRARQIAFDRDVAVKYLARSAADPDSADRFRRECTAVGSLSGHPNVVTVFDAGVVNGSDAYIAMELVSGGTLLDRIESGPLPVQEAVEAVAAIADAVDAAHNIGLLHRDIKPGNILFGADGVPKLADFGISSLLAGDTTTTGRSVSVSYAAPELLQGGAATVRSDVYALGATLHHLLSGEAPFHADGNLGAAALLAVTEEPSPIPGVPDSLGRVIHDSMAKQPRLRPGSASEFAALIRDSIRAGATPPPPTPAVAGPPPSSPGSMRGRRGLITAAVAAGLVIAAIVFVPGGDGEPDGATPTSTTEPTASTTATSAPVTETAGATALPLTGFEARSIGYGGLEFEVRGVTVTDESLRSYAEDRDEAAVDGQFHAILDMQVTNPLGSSLVGFDGAYFSLEVGGDTIAAADTFLSDIVGYQQPNTSQESFLAFPVDEGVDLSDAALVLGAPPDRPARLPLLGTPPESGYPITIEQSGRATGVGPTNGGTIEFTLLDATLALDLPHEHTTSPTGPRADQGEVFLQLHIRAEKTEGRGNDLIQNGIRVLFDDAPVAPFDVATTPTGSNASPVAEPGAAVDGWVLVLMPVDATSVALQVGDFEEDPGLILVELPSLPTS